jgi:hypothetical protein
MYICCFKNVKPSQHPILAMHASTEGSIDFTSGERRLQSPLCDVSLLLDNSFSFGLNGFGLAAFVLERVVVVHDAAIKRVHGAVVVPVQLLLSCIAQNSVRIASGTKKKGYKSMNTGVIVADTAPFQQ